MPILLVVGLKTDTLWYCAGRSDGASTHQSCSLEHVDVLCVRVVYTYMYMYIQRGREQGERERSRGPEGVAVC